ncbi:MAG: hypothetical protein ACREAM_01615, partial [Blastocatellia bacterium]
RLLASHRGAPLIRTQARRQWLLSHLLNLSGRRATIPLFKAALRAIFVSNKRRLFDDKKMSLDKPTRKPLSSGLA